MSILQDCLNRLSMQTLPAPAQSLCIVEMKTTEGGVVVDNSNGREQQIGPSSTSFLNIGLQVRSSERFVVRRK